MMLLNPGITEQELDALAESARSRSANMFGVEKPPAVSYI
jgi:hypothetical protein